MKTIDICMISWPKTPYRIGCMDRTLGTLRENSHASRHKLEFYVSLEMWDVSTKNFVEARRICEKHGATASWRAKPPSLGGNGNDALMTGYGEFKILNQDDWQWSYRTDISDDADFLEAHPEFAMVRFSMHFYQTESVLGQRPLGRQLISIQMLSSDYVYGGEPHMRRSDFSTKRSAIDGEPVGFYLPGDTDSGNYADPENNMNWHLRQNGWKVAGYSPNLSEHNATESTRPVELGGVAAC